MVENVFEMAFVLVEIRPLTEELSFSQAELFYLGRETVTPEDEAKHEERSDKLLVTKQLNFLAVGALHFTTEYRDLQT